MSRVLRILNISKSADGTWKWLDGKLPEELGARFIHCYGAPRSALERRITRPNLALQRGCAEAAWHVAQGRVDVLVSHLPVVSKWTEIYMCGNRRNALHIAFAFNLDRLPTGLNKRLYSYACQGIDRFVVFTNAERALYAEVLGIPEERIKMIHWGVTPPRLSPHAPPLVQGEYISSIGRTGRNYRDLIAAMRRLPDIKAVIVAAPENLVGLDVPQNVEILTNVPFPKALNILSNSRFLVLPLYASDVPYGHGTAVLGMHLRRPVLATAGAAMTDYVQDGVTGLTFPPSDPDALSQSIRTLMEDQDLNERLAENAHRFALEHCTEEATLRQVVPLLRDMQRAS